MHPGPRASSAFVSGKPSTPAMHGEHRSVVNGSRSPRAAHSHEPESNGPAGLKATKVLGVRVGIWIDDRAGALLHVMRMVHHDVCDWIEMS